MRVFLAFALGFVAAVGGAFLRDSTTAPPGRPFVNWEVVQESADGTATQVREQWNRLTQR